MAHLGDHLGPRHRDLLACSRSGEQVAVLASTAGYAFSKMRWRGRKFGFLFTLSWMAIPPLLLMVPIYVEMVNLGLIDTVLRNFSTIADFSEIVIA